MDEKIYKERLQLLEQIPLVNLREMLDDAAARYGERIAFEQVEGKNIKSYSYIRLQHDVHCLAQALWAEGYGGEHVAVIGKNSYEWICCYLAAVIVGVAVPIDKELPAGTVAQMLTDSDTSIMLCDKSYEDVAQDCGDRLDRYFIWEKYKETPKENSIQVMIEKGQEMLANGRNDFAQREIREKDIANIIFTSGTTGANKPVTLTHKNVCANVKSIVKSFPYVDVSFSVLPMNHAFELNCHILPAICFGMKVGICSSLKNLMRDIAAFKPGMTVVVPLFIDEVYNGIWKKARSSKQYYKLQSAIIFSNALRAIGIDKRETLFKGVRDNFGGNLSQFVCGGAPMNMKTAKGLEDLGFNILSGYGITECSPLVSVQLEGKITRGGVGPSVPGVEIHIENADKDGIGEVWVRGENVTPGYYNGKDADASTFEGEWFKTGDYGKIDNKGSLRLVGRKKNLIILPNGKNVHPEELESKILEPHDYVKDVIVYQGNVRTSTGVRECICAGISIDKDSPLAKESEQSRNEIIKNDINKLNYSLAPYKRIEQVYVTLEEFEKTATRKVIRNKAMYKGDLVAL